MPDPELPLSFCNPSAFAFDAETAIALLADTHIRRAIERGDLDDLPGSGRPLDLSDADDPDWWSKRLMKREGIVFLPPSIQLRKDDAVLDVQLDELSDEAAVRHEIERFNQRVTLALRRPPSGPPVITAPRDIEDTVAAWSERRAERVSAARRARAPDAEDRPRPRRTLLHALRRRRSRHGTAATPDADPSSTS